MHARAVDDNGGGCAAGDTSVRLPPQLCDLANKDRETSTVERSRLPVIEVEA